MLAQIRHMARSAPVTLAGLARARLELQVKRVLKEVSRWAYSCNIEEHFGVKTEHG